MHDYPPEPGDWKRDLLFGLFLLAFLFAIGCAL